MNWIWKMQRNNGSYFYVNINRHRIQIKWIIKIHLKFIDSVVLWNLSGSGHLGRYSKTMTLYDVLWKRWTFCYIISKRQFSTLIIIRLVFFDIHTLYFNFIQPFSDPIHWTIKNRYFSKLSRLIIYYNWN